MPNAFDPLPDTLFMHMTPAALHELLARPELDVRAEQGVLGLDAPVARVRLAREAFGAAAPEGRVAVEFDTGKFLYIAAPEANSSMPFFTGPEDMRAYLATLPSNDGLVAAIVGRAPHSPGHSGGTSEQGATGDESVAGLLWHLPFGRPAAFGAGNTWSDYRTYVEPLHQEPSDVERPQSAIADTGWPDESALPPEGEAWLIVAKDVYLTRTDGRHLVGGREEHHHEDFGLAPDELDSAIENGLGEDELRRLHSLGVQGHRASRFRPAGRDTPGRNRNVSRVTQEQWAAHAADFTARRAAGARFGVRPFEPDERVVLHLLLASGSGRAAEVQSVIVPDGFDATRIEHIREWVGELVHVARVSDPPPMLVVQIIRVG